MDDKRIPALMSTLPVNREIKKLRDDRKRINNKNNSKDLLLNAVTVIDKNELFSLISNILVLQLEKNNLKKSLFYGIDRHHAPSGGYTEADGHHPDIQASGYGARGQPVRGLTGNCKK
ncbi:hypothetical protein [Trichococcus patagoniensis]|uniref:hypothetical protein n=1 Tax=Trichococcus patagoniensis TaxID=382641 RepID=UPI000D38F182|nr:hypothetical protein [Trichococcus patagoniensis]